VTLIEWRQILSATQSCTVQHNRSGTSDVLLWRDKHSALELFQSMNMSNAAAPFCTLSCTLSCVLPLTSVLSTREGRGSNDTAAMFDSHWPTSRQRYFSLTLCMHHSTDTVVYPCQTKRLSAACACRAIPRTPCLTCSRQDHRRCKTAARRAPFTPSTE